MLDSNMLWTSHTNLVCIKLSKTIGIIKRLNYTFPNKILFSLYNSLFIPYIQYGLLLWGSKYSNVEKLQKRAISLATGSHYIAHTEPLFKLYYNNNNNNSNNNNNIFISYMLHVFANSTL